MITNNGSAFMDGATVTLTAGARVYEKRPMYSLTAKKIQIKINSDKNAGMWMAEI